MNNRSVPIVAAVAAMGVCAAGCQTPRHVTVPSMPPLIPAPKPSVFWTEPFNLLDLHRWRDISVTGQTRYAAVTLDGRPCLRAQSQAGASILVSTVRFDPHLYPWLSWDWRVDQFIAKEALDRTEGSDASARVYVYFHTKGLPWQKRNLDYVWSSVLPVETLLTSPFSAESKILVAESGTDAVGRWRSIRRNLEADYRKAFGTDAPRVLAIGIMTDTDSTGGAAVAYVDDLRVSR